MAQTLTDKFKVRVFDSIGHCIVQIRTRKKLISNTIKKTVKYNRSRVMAFEMVLLYI